MVTPLQERYKCSTGGDLDRVIRKTVPERAGLAAVHTRDVVCDYNHALGLQTKARFDALDGEGVTTYYDACGQII